VAILVESAPGDVAQVDLGNVGKLYDATAGRLRKVWFFLLVLAHSRLTFAGTGPVQAIANGATPNALAILRRRRV
jgi:hypothetical protein